MYKRRKSKQKVLSILALVFFAIIYYKTENIYYAAVATLILLFVNPIMYLLKRKYRKWSYLNSPMSKVDEMEGHEFEEYLKAHFEKLGYRCKNVGKNGHDYGVDLIISKAGIKTAVQAKRYNNAVGIKAVQEIVSGMNYYDCDKAMVVTNSTFTSSAAQLAKKCNVELWDRNKCKKEFK